MVSRKVTTGAFHTTPRMKELIDEVLASGQISYGKMSRKFERDFAAIHHASYATLSNSGTSSLHVALQTLKELHGWEDGDEVLVPATTFVATANIVKHVGMHPVFVDIEKDTYGIDPDLIEEKITDKTRAIIPVHLFGQPCKMFEINPIAKAHNLRIIEDSCEAMFVSQANHPVGSMGDIGCFSMYVAHLITAGVGGISITDNPDYAIKMRSLVNHGLSAKNLNLDDHCQPQPMIGRRFQFDAMGHSFRITEFEAALGLAQLDTWEEMIKIRRRNGKHYTASLKLINSLYQTEPYKVAEVLPGNEHAYMMYGLAINPNPYNETMVDKKPLVDFLNSKGIETRDSLPILGQPVYAYLNPEDFPTSNWIKTSGFYVGCHQFLDGDDIKYVLNALSEFAHDELKYTKD